MKLKIRNIVIPIAVFIIFIIITFYFFNTAIITITFEPDTSQEAILNSVHSMGGDISSTISSDNGIDVEVRVSNWNKLFNLGKLKNDESITNIKDGSLLELEEF